MAEYLRTLVLGGRTWVSDRFKSCMAAVSAMRSSVATSDLAATDCAREAERGLLTLIGSGAALDRVFWFALLAPLWFTLQCLAM